MSPALVLLSLACLAAQTADAPRPSSPVMILFDTDMDSDCDDLGALAMLHVLADRGEARILATVVSSRNEWSPACVDAVNTWYGRPDLPIGRPGKDGASKPSRYARALAERFPHDLGPVDAVPDALSVYRKVLAAAPDHSVVVVTVGYLTNVANLLALPASGGEPAGIELVKRKVKLWVCMGGNFVGRPAVDDLKLGNNNFTVDKASAHAAVHGWPGKITFVGREIGSVPSGLKVGSKLGTLAADHPLRVGYGLYFGGQPKDRHVADQTAVLFAVRGPGHYWDVESDGFMDLARDMTFRWRPDRHRGHAYLLKKTVNGKPNDHEIEKVIEDLMMTPRSQPTR